MQKQWGIKQFINNILSVSKSISNSISNRRENEAMIGILTEKPSACANFATALGGMSGSFQGQRYQLVSARGHLYEYKDPDEMVPDNLKLQYKSWDLKNLPWDETVFSWERKKKQGADQALSGIKTVLSTCDEIVIATDVDPSGEGELIAWEIFDELGYHNKKVSRMFFVDESEKEIQKAFLNRKPIPSMQGDMDFVKAQFRTRWDLLSMQFTRIATNCAPDRSVLRQGRLKSAMIRITGEGLDAVANYKKVVKYTNKFRDENGVIYSSTDEPICDKKTDVSQSYHDSPVVLDNKSLKHTTPPKLIDLAGLSSRLSSKGVKAKQVLSVYQAMYEAKIVSYPRTEDKTITPEQFNDMLPLVDKIAKVVGVDPSLLTHRQPRPTHVKSGGAHGANRPGPNVPKALDDLKKYGSCGPAIYEILAKSFLAMLSEDYEYESQKGHLQDYPKFTGSASVPKKMGWKAVFTDDDTVDDASSGLGRVASPYIADVVNPKPPTPTMKWLMKQLENNDVGTGATRVQTYSDVTSDQVKYPLLCEAKGKLGMTRYGRMSYILLNNTLIGDVHTTEQLNQQMRQVAAGELDPKDGLYAVRAMVEHDRQVMQSNVATLKQEMPDIEEKPVVSQKAKYEGTWKRKKVSFNREWGGHTFTDEECERLCNGEEIEITGLVSKKGNTYGVKGKLAKQKYNGHEYVGFLKTGFADAGVPDEYCKHRFSDQEKADLNAGKTIYVDGMVSSAGNVFGANVSYKVKPGDTNRSIVLEYKN